MNKNKHLPIFNNFMEISLRIAILLSELDGKYCDLNRLTYYDYLLIHSGDIENAPESLHPENPFRIGDVLARRELIKKAVEFLCKKQLITTNFNENGIVYSSSSLTKVFINHLDSSYSEKTKGIAKWIASEFHLYGDKELSEYITNNLHKWGGNFSQVGFRSK
ncbi:MAG: ABC-three component system middle component 2 [bacterium]